MNGEYSHQIFSKDGISFFFLLLIKLFGLFIHMLLQFLAISTVEAKIHDSREKQHQCCDPGHHFIRILEEPERNG